MRTLEKNLKGWRISLLSALLLSAFAVRSQGGTAADDAVAAEKLFLDAAALDVRDLVRMSRLSPVEPPNVERPSSVSRAPRSGAVGPYAKRCMQAFFEADFDNPEEYAQGCRAVRNKYALEGVESLISNGYKLNVWAEMIEALGAIKNQRALDAVASLFTRGYPTVDPMTVRFAARAVTARRSACVQDLTARASDVSPLLILNYCLR